MAHVFVSYAHTDVDFASTLIRRLNAAGFATVDAESVRGFGFAELEAALEGAFCALVTFTPNVLDDQQMFYEWAFALGAKKMVFPVLLRPTELPQRLRISMVLDFTDFAARPWDELLKQMHDARGDYIANLLPIPQNTPPEIRAALLQIESTRDEERRLAINILAEMEHPTALEALASAAEHKRRDVRVYAALRLAARTRYRDERALAGLLEALDMPQETLQLEAVHALGRLGDSAAAGLLISAPETVYKLMRTVVDALVEMLKREHKEVRHAAALHLGAIGDPTCVPALRAALHDPIINNRAMVATALGKIGDNSACIDLLNLLNDEIALVRQSAAEALGKIGDPVAVPTLVKTLSEWSNDVRQAAANALGMIGDPSAIPQLLDVLHDERMGARGAAARALAMIGKPALAGLIAELRNKDSYVRQYTATALGMVGDERAVEELVKMLNDQTEVPFVRHAAAEALVDIGAAGVPGLILGLNDPDPEIREVIAEALELIGTAEAYEALSAWQSTEEV